VTLIDITYYSDVTNVLQLMELTFVEFTYRCCRSQVLMLAS